MSDAFVHPTPAPETKADDYVRFCHGGQAHHNVAGGQVKLSTDQLSKRRALGSAMPTGQVVEQQLCVFEGGDGIRTR